MIGRTWWRNIVNPVRFLNDAEDSLISGKSVILNFPDAVPWQDFLMDALQQRLELTADDRTFEIHSGKDIKAPGEYLFRHYCSEEERGKYWAPTHQSYEKFLAVSDKTTLTHRYLCFTDMNSANVPLWVKSITDYADACKEGEDHGLFILLSQGAGNRGTKHVDVYQYADYITDYDCLMLCQTLISSLSCTSTAKQYISQVASDIAKNQVELAGLLVSHELALIKNPETVARSVFNENGISCENLRERVNIAVWESQIKIIFPRLERFRREFIQKYQSKLKKFLPITGSHGKSISELNELELGELYYLCSANLSLESSEFRMLSKMRDARNSLAHWETIPYDMLTNDLKLL